MSSKKVLMTSKRPIKDWTTGMIFLSISHTRRLTGLNDPMVRNILDGNENKLTDYQFEFIDVCSFDELIREVLINCKNTNESIMKYSTSDRIRSFLINSGRRYGFSPYEPFTICDFIIFAVREENKANKDIFMKNAIVDVLANCASCCIQDRLKFKREDFHYRTRHKNIIIGEKK